jgi:hypothetical protein
MGGIFWYPAPCDQPLGCCQIFDGSGEIIYQSTTQTQCISLEGNWFPEPCPDDEPCDECCEAILALLESFTGDIQAPLRSWLLEDPQQPEPQPSGVVPEGVEVLTGEADDYFSDITIPDGPTNGTNWSFDVLGTQATFNISLDPRNWPADPMHNTLAAFILLMRIAMAVGLTIMFGSLVGRVFRQW